MSIKTFHSSISCLRTIIFLEQSELQQAILHLNPSTTTWQMVLDHHRFCRFHHKKPRKQANAVVSHLLDSLDLFQWIRGPSCTRSYRIHRSSKTSANSPQQPKSEAETIPNVQHRTQLLNRPPMVQLLKYRNSSNSRRSQIARRWQRLTSRSKEPRFSRSWSNPKIEQWKWRR